MKRILWLPALLLAASPAFSQASLSAEDWQIAAQPQDTTLTLSHKGLGTVLTDVRLNVRIASGLKPIPKWSVSSSDEKTLTVQTTNPRTTWSFRLDAEAVQISCTTSDAVLTAVAPAPSQRFPARLLDPQGSSVTWSGTREVANGYDGAETRNPSALPQQNSEVMYFSLGQISAAGLHSLFDRKTDTAIDFSSRTSLQRSQTTKDVLNVTMPVPGTTTIRLIPDYFTKKLGAPYYVPFDDSVFSKAPMVWSSWTNYYAEVTENDVVQNADWIADHLKKYGFQYVQLDDGYDRGQKGEHYWIEKWDHNKFPHGPQWLTDHIKAKGLHAGIWLVPNAYAGAVADHPDWYVRDNRGNLILDYQTPTLDSTNPEVLAFLKRLFNKLDGWGFEYYKFDGEHAFSKYVPAVDRSKLHDSSIDPLVTYRDRLKLIRETVGPNVFIEGCPAGTPLNGIQYFNSYFNGDDVYNSWNGMYALFSSINANAFLNHLLVYVMPGEGIDIGPFMSVEEGTRKRNATFRQVAETREKPVSGFGTTLPEARTLVTYLALTGVVYPLASNLPELPKERIELLKTTLPTLPIFPVDLFSRGTDMTWDMFRHVQADSYIHNYPEILDLKVSAASGTYDVLGVTNWRSELQHRQLAFADKLGLPADVSYAVFDGWRQQYLGIFKNTLELDVEPHDTRVLLIHGLLNQPQLIGNSRHLTGAYSINELTWDAGRNTLRGSSETIPEERYALTFAVPAGMTAGNPRVTGENGQVITFDRKATRGSLVLSFVNAGSRADWTVPFLRSR